jgi:hypothetical protein
MTSFRTRLQVHWNLDHRLRIGCCVPFGHVLLSWGNPRGTVRGTKRRKNWWYQSLIYDYLYWSISLYTYIYRYIYIYIYMYLYRCIYICIYIYTYIYILIYLSLCWSRYQSALIYINLYQSHSLDIRPRPNEANKFFGHELIGTILPWISMFSLLLLGCTLW